ncbi:2Fe-2S iron-sulfur cluster binding domain-containing protein, partial [Pseudomonas sp.]|uniref:2Fe-2S iron-sulfur cluster-binding protein n=1 Tax=Pseudomonas sp. TaxID=306 RepID=UPI00258B550C
ATVRVKARIDGVVLNIDPGKSLLEGLEEQGVSIPNQCRAGICGRCRIKVRSGEYRTRDDFAISAKDRAQGHVLACCTYPLGDEISVERPGAQ